MPPARFTHHTSAAVTAPRVSPPPRPGHARGLGTADALAVELRPQQLPPLLEEIEADRKTDEAWLGSPEPGDDPDERARRAHQLRVLATIVAQIPSEACDGKFEIVGPQTTITELVRQTTHTVVERLDEELQIGDSLDQLKASAELTQMWLDTHIAVEATNAYRFEPADTAFEGREHQRLEPQDASGTRRVP